MALVWFGAMPATALAQNARVVFKPSAGNVDFVRVYVGSQPRVYDATVDLRTFQLGSMGDVSAMDPALSQLLTQPRVYYIALTSVDAQRRESPFSNEIKIDRTTPSGGNPTGGSPTGGGGPVNAGPTVSVFANGQPIANGIRIRAGQPMNFSVRASDPDGLGFPLFRAFGVTANVSYVWDFGGGSPMNSLAAFSPNPTVRFGLNGGEASRRFNAQLTVIDRLGAFTRVNVPVDVDASLPPSVTLFVNSAVATGSPTFMVRAGQPVALRAVGTDPDGLGFPVFSGFPAVTHLWDFGGGTPENMLSIFAQAPVVRFALAANETQKTVRVSVGVLDSTGSIARREVFFAVTR